MTKKLVELSEDENAFHISGGAELSLSKEGGTILMYRPIYGAILREYVERFQIDEEKNPPDLYLFWKRDYGKEEKTLLGKIGNIKIAQEWVAKVNRGYRS